MAQTLNRQTAKRPNTLLSHNGTDGDAYTPPIFRDDGWPIQDHGVVPNAPGLYFLGLPFQRSFASVLTGGVGRDAAYIASKIASRARLEQRHTVGVAATL